MHINCVLPQIMLSGSRLVAFRANSLRSHMTTWSWRLVDEGCTIDTCSTTFGAEQLWRVWAVSSVWLASSCTRRVQSWHKEGHRRYFRQAPVSYGMYSRETSFWMSAKLTLFPMWPCFPTDCTSGRHVGSCGGFLLPVQASLVGFCRFRKQLFGVFLNKRVRWIKSVWVRAELDTCDDHKVGL